MHFSKVASLAIVASAGFAAASPIIARGGGDGTPKPIPDPQGLSGILAALQGTIEKITQLPYGRERKRGIDFGLNLQDTPLSSIPELIPLIQDLGIPAGAKGPYGSP